MNLNQQVTPARVRLVYNPAAAQRAGMLQQAGGAVPCGAPAAHAVAIASREPAPAAARLTLGLLVRGLESEDGDVLRQALAYVSTKDDAAKTAAALFKSDPKAREQFPEERQLAGYLLSLGAAATRGTEAERRRLLGQKRGG